MRRDFALTEIRKIRLFWPDVGGRLDGPIIRIQRRLQQQGGNAAGLPMTFSSARTLPAARPFAQQLQPRLARLHRLSRVLLDDSRIGAPTNLFGEDSGSCIGRAGGSVRFFFASNP